METKGRAPSFSPALVTLQWPASPEHPSQCVGARGPFCTLHHCQPLTFDLSIEVKYVSFGISRPHVTQGGELGQASSVDTAVPYILDRIAVGLCMVPT